MYRFCKLISILQSLDVAEVGHPSIDVFQIENLEDGVVSHVLGVTARAWVRATMTPLAAV